jgi:phage terminase small subunit
MAPLDNPKHEAFAQAIAKGKTADEAYALAGYKPNHGNATRLKSNEAIRNRVAVIGARAAEKAEITISRVLQELARVGMADFRKAFDADGKLLPIEEWGDDLAAAVSSIEVVTRSLPGEADDELDPQPHGGALARKRNAKVEYIHKVRFWDKNAALEKIAKYLGMFVDRHEFGGINGAPIKTEVTHTLDKASAKLIASLVE